MMAMLIMPTAFRDFTIHISMILFSMIPGIMILTFIIPAGRLDLAGDGDGIIRITAGDIRITAGDIRDMAGDIRGIIHPIIRATIHRIIQDIILRFMLIQTHINTDKGVPAEPT
jgi:uncharacterized ion transporter superfamily protein YfcC